MLRFELLTELDRVGRSRSQQLARVLLFLGNNWQGRIIKVRCTGKYGSQFAARKECEQRDVN